MKQIYLKIRKTTKITLDKYNSFCIKLNSRHHVGAAEFKEINWLPTKEIVGPSVTTSTSRYWKEIPSFKFNELFGPSINIYKTRSHIALEMTLGKSNLGQKRI